MQSLNRYPYKYMTSIVHALSTNGSNLRSLRSVSGACLPDSLEVMKMLTYLTNRGKVVKNDEKYLLQCIGNDQVSKPRRMYLIQELNSLLGVLNNIPQTIQEIQVKIDWTKSKKELGSYLDFLVKITSKGPIKGGISFLGMFLQQGNWRVGTNYSITELV